MTLILDHGTNYPVKGKAVLHQGYIKYKPIPCNDYCWACKRGKRLDTAWGDKA